MSGPLRPMAETLARATPRRRLLGRAATGLFALLAGGAAAGLGEGVLAGQATVCAPPGPLCECQYCLSGVCQKPCVFNTTWYASGCWVTSGVTCCDCTCPWPQGICGCASDVCP